MDLEGDLTKMLASNLPHEIVHTVLADYFRRPVPRWADEGAAVLAESSDEQRHHDRLVRIYLKKGAALPVRRLLAMKEYGEVQDVMTIFAQGHSVARFLVARKDRAAFLKFVKAGMGGDWDNAAKTCYGFENVEALEAAWLADLDATRNDPGEALGTTLGALNKRADEAYLAKDFEKAIALWRDLQDRYPDSPDALYVNLRVGTAYWGIARLADEKSRADGKRIDEALAARRRDALLQARDSFQIIEQQMLAWQLAGGIVVAEDEEKLKRASFWGADVDFWLARYDMARSHYTALAIRYAGKPEEMIAWSQIRQCLVLMHQPEKANRVVGRMKERLTAIRFETAEQAIGTHKRKFWEEYLAETAKPLPTEMGPEPGR
jgi:tetratricopeptide (TPR) repeat protein